MQIINVHQAKTNLSKLIENVLSGQEIIIAKAGKPVAKIIAYKENANTRKPGLLKGKILLSNDFTRDDERINKHFQGI